MAKLTQIKGFGKQRIYRGLDFCLDLKVSFVKVPIARVYLMSRCPHYIKKCSDVLDSSIGQSWIISSGCSIPIVTSVRDIAATYTGLSQDFGLDSRMFVLSEVPEAYMLELTQQGSRPYEKKPNDKRIAESAFVLSALKKVDREYAEFLENII